MKVTHFKKVSETSGVCVLLRLYLFIIEYFILCVVFTRHSSSL